ncbi:exocyst complex component 1-like isoform X2 [Actinia tenebrosa]|uniref:Exocyst complex component 1-like isoform X2 n=1 Tax=Actinia tenebrosa TaxID=6105 RepID=A0A6P8HHB6_ACTTE|nr:exocyst complex component 1-like isoform X2 [Actinia tenebrosa]
MAAIRHNLQREVFKPSEERLYAVVNVTKAGKKKKASFLCAAVTMDKPETVSLYQVKKTDKDTYKKKATWRFRDLTIIDGKDATKDTPEFDLHFEKTYKWVASSHTEKLNFIIALWKLCVRYPTQRKPTLMNVNTALIEESINIETGRAQQHTDEGVTVEDYQELTQREENDLEHMMSQTENAISNLEEFNEQLSRELSVLDSANIQSIMASEDQVNSLMDLLEASLAELDKLDTRLTQYDEVLKTVHNQMEQMEDKDRHMETESANRNKLIKEVEYLVGTLGIPERHITALKQGDLSKGLAVKECTNAAEAVLAALTADIHPGLTKMKAVKEQQEKYEQISKDFAHRLKQHLLGIFQQHGVDTDMPAKHSSELHLPKHLNCHKELLPYCDLMKWLKEIDPEVFLELCLAYVNSLSKIYERQLKEFFETARQRAISKGSKSMHSAFKMTSSNPISKLDDHGVRMSPRPSPRPLTHKFRGRDRRDTGDSGSDSISQSGSIGSYESASLTLETRGRFDRVFDILLSELEPVCTSEQQFVQKFFDFSMDEFESQDSSGGGSDASDGAFMSKGSGDVRERKQLSEDVRRRKMNERREEIKKVMQGLFSNLDSELHAFIQFGDKLDSFNSMYMLVRIGQYVITNQLSGAPVSYLSQQLGNCLITVKRLFDKFIANLIRQIEEAKIQKNKRVGILPFVSKFEEFVENSEGIFKNAERRTDLDKAYIQLTRVVFDNVERVAMESLKSPKAVVMLENYHHLLRVLSRLKISCLEKEKLEAKEKYGASLEEYVKGMLGRPMEKLSVFFEGVQEKIAAGVKAEEVGYQLAFSKQELRKCIKEVPAKELKKGLEHLYKKVEKQLCDEESLLQVVWNSMQKEFIEQYKNFVDLINRCYPGSMITLEYTIKDVLFFFSNIASSH